MKVPTYHPTVSVCDPQQTHQQQGYHATADNHSEKDARCEEKKTSSLNNFFDYLLKQKKRLIKYVLRIGAHTTTKNSESVNVAFCIDDLFDLTLDLEQHCITSIESVFVLSDACRRQHHASVGTRIPRDGTLDGESRLHPFDMKRLHLEDDLVLPQVRRDELTSAECLQGVRHSASEFDSVALADCGRPRQRDVCWEKISCMAEGENERQEIRLTKNCFGGDKTAYL